MAIYYVNTAADAGGNGTTDATTGANCAWDTIADVNAASFSADDFIRFKCGCTWNATLTPPSSGTSGHPITFNSYGSGAKPIISGAGLTSCVTDTAGKGYITIDNLEFANPNEYGILHYYWISTTEGSTPNWTIQNCKFTNCGVDLFGPNTIVQDNVFTGPQPVAALDGCVIIHGLVATNCSVLRNTISGFSDRGIWFYKFTDSPTANDNTVYDIAVGTSAAGYGINFDGYGYLITGTVTAHGNTIYNCDFNGIELENCSDGSVVNNNLIYNCGGAGIIYANYAALPTRYVEQRGNDVGGLVDYNIVYHCRYAIWLREVSGVDIWNNVLYDGLGSYPDGLHITDSGTYFVDTIDFRNNIIGSGMTRCISTQFAWENHFSTLDYCAVANPVITERDTSTNLTLATLQGGATQMNCFTTSPAFTDATNHDFTLGGASPCIGTGVSVGLTTDFLGYPILGTPDIGAYEYGAGMPILEIRVHGRK